MKIRSFVTIALIALAPPCFAQQIAGDSAREVTGEDISQEAQSYIGLKYAWGGTSLKRGADCSGFVQAVYKKLGIASPRTVAELRHAGKQVTLRTMQPGDMVFFETIGDRISHVGIYIGHGKMVHAPRTGKTVRVDKMYTKYWGSRYRMARRMTRMDYQQYAY